MDVYQILGRDHQTLQQIFLEINKTNISETERSVANSYLELCIPYASAGRD
jgi:hypothetical protein